MRSECVFVDFAAKLYVWQKRNFESENTMHIVKHGGVASCYGSPLASWLCSSAIISPFFKMINLLLFCWMMKVPE